MIGARLLVGFHHGVEHLIRDGGKALIAARLVFADADFSEGRRIGNRYLCVTSFLRPSAFVHICLRQFLAHTSLGAHADFGRGISVI